MDTLRFYVYLCIFQIKGFPAEDASDSSKIAPVYEDIYVADETGKQPPTSDGSESKSSQESAVEQSDDDSGKQPAMAGDILNTFKKPFININQGRNGWPEENLILKLMGGHSDDIAEGGTPYQLSVRSLGFTRNFNTCTKI